MSRRCPAITKKGARCAQAPLHDSSYCFWHAPENQAQVTEVRRLGGLRRRREVTVASAYDLEKLDGMADLVRLLQIVVMDTLALENGVQRNRTLAYLIQVGKAVFEQTETLVRLQVLEEAWARPRWARQRGRVCCAALEEKEMASVNARLQRLHEHLGPLVQARLVLQAIKAEEPPPRLSLKNLTEFERRQLNEYIDQINLANGAPLTHYLISVRLIVERLAVQVDCYALLQVWQEQLTELEALARVLVRQPVSESEFQAIARRARRSLPAGRPAWTGTYDVRPDTEDIAQELGLLERLQTSLHRLPFEYPGTVSIPVRAGSVSGLAAGLGEVLSGEIAYWWRGVRCAELIVEEVAASLGEDPLRPGMREHLETAKQGLIAGRDCLAAFEETVVLAEPDEDEVAELREYALRGELPNEQRPSGWLG